MDRFETLGLDELNVLKKALEAHMVELAYVLHTTPERDRLHRAKAERDLAVARSAAMKLRMQRLQALIDMAPAITTATEPARLAA